MMPFFFGFILARLMAGGLGYTKDEKIRSQKPFAVDDDLYICRLVEAKDIKHEEGK